MRDYRRRPNDTYSFMRHQVSLQRETTSRTDTGAERQSWSTIATLWAGRKVVTEAEEDDTMQVTATQVVEWVVRYRADIKESDRILHQGRTYNILGIDDMGMNDFLTIRSYVIRA